MFYPNLKMDLYIGYDSMAETVLAFLTKSNEVISMFSKNSLYLSLIFILIYQPVFSQKAKTTGTISGIVVDGETGDPLPMVNIVLDGTSWGAATDLEGKYRVLNIPAGNYDLRATMIGYSKKRIEGVQVEVGETTVIDFAIGMEVLEGQEVVVTAKAVKNTEAALLKDRQKALAVSDAISAEAISRAGSGNAAEAMKQVTGASVVGGRYVYVRGLGDRYTSTQLNGAEIPSTNPYKRAGSIDLIPSNLIDNIVTAKSFTPDKPGNFSGGTVDIKTKDFPDHLMLQFSAGTSYNSQSTLNSDGPISYMGGDRDWLGLDDGTRDIPSELNPEDVFIPDVGAAGKDWQTATLLDSYSNAFNSVMVPTPEKFPLAQSYAFSVGNQLNLFGRPFGFLTSLSYNNNYSSYDDGELNRWNLGSSQQATLGNDFALTDTKSTHEVLWGGLLKTSYKFSPSHMLSFDAIYNQNGESTARYLEGKNPYDLDPTATFRTSVLQYIERSLSSYQLSGEHHFPALLNSRVTWKATAGKTTQNEPDLRYFTSFKTNKGLYGIKPNIPPQRLFRFMDENRDEASMDIAIPFKFQSRPSTIKIGGLVAKKERDYRERLFEYSQNPTFNYIDGSADSLFGQGNVGLVDSTIREINGKVFKRYDFGLVVSETFMPENNYVGDQDISAAYIMLDMPVINKVRFIGGVRYETTRIDVETEDKDAAVGHVATDDFLPSLNLVYSMGPDMNVRLAFGKTLARPLFREIAPYASFDFVGGDTYIGNANLKRTLIENYDIRWEWFCRPGEIYAVSAFWKNFYNPIEVAILNVNHEIMWKNVDNARVYGVEFEARKSLDVISGRLRNFSAGGNLSLVNSRVGITEAELIMIKATRQDASETREFAGQSPYILNLNLSYDNYGKGISSSLYYNVFGERLSIVSLGGTPDVYEQPAEVLNFSFSWEFIKNLSAKLAVKNMLDSENKHTQQYNGRDYIYHLYHTGRSISLGFAYKL